MMIKKLLNKWPSVNNNQALGSDGFVNTTKPNMVKKLL